MGGVEPGVICRNGFMERMAEWEIIKGRPREEPGGTPEEKREGLSTEGLESVGEDV